MSITYTELYDLVGKKIKPSRFQHSIDVASVCIDLAKRFSLDAEAASIVGIYHDAYRYVDCSLLFDEIEEAGWEIMPEERESPMLLHGAVAAMHFDHDAGSVPLSYKLAVRHHTLGSVRMGTLGAILYIADYIEPGRKHLSDEDRALILSERSLEDMTMRIMDMQRPYFIKEGIKEAGSSLELYDFLKEGGKL